MDIRRGGQRRRPVFSPSETIFRISDCCCGRAWGGVPRRGLLTGGIDSGLSAFPQHGAARLREGPTICIIIRLASRRVNRLGQAAESRSGFPELLHDREQRRAESATSDPASRQRPHHRRQSAKDKDRNREAAAAAEGKVRTTRTRAGPWAFVPVLESRIDAEAVDNFTGCGQRSGRVELSQYKRPA